LNYAGKFDATLASNGVATHSHAYVHVDSSQTHAPADALIVPDAQLLFHADYKRAGVDLILSKDDHEFVLHDYFKGAKRAPLASADGAHLTADIVKALVGEVEVSQAGTGAAASQVIGHCTKLQGSATVIRNGVSVILNMGDNVEKGDVVQTGANSTVGITFIDGTVFGLSSNARMVLNEMVYDPNGSSNSSLLSLVAGTITFVAGETAKHGDMKIDTPVATMGIRGTAVLVEIDFNVPGQSGAPNASFQVLVEPDGTTGSYILFDKTTLQPIAIVNQAGQQLNINNGIISQTTTPLSPEIQKLITDVFQQKFTDNSNTKTNSPFNDSITPQQGPIIKLASGPTAIPIIAITGDSLGSSTPPPTPQTPGPFHVPGTLRLQSLNTAGLVQSSFAASELAGKTGDIFDFQHVGGTFHFQDINLGDRPSVTAEFGSVIYTDAAHNSFTIANGQTSAPSGLSNLQFADIAATAIQLFLVPDSGNTNNGNVTWVYAVRDNAFDFLAAGETLTFTYHINVNSNFAPGPESAGLDVTIVVTGTNDKPVITTGPRTIDFAAGTSTKGGDLTTTDPTSGTFAFTDVDLTDKHTVSAKLKGAVMSNGGTVPPLPEQFFESALTASIKTDSTGTGNGVVHWEFADDLPVYLADFIPKGETVTLTYTVTVKDSHGATSEQTVTVNITGTDAAGEVWIHTTTDGHDSLWTTGKNWGTGNAPSSTDDVIIITDQLHPNTPSYPVLIAEGVAAFAHSVKMDDFAEQSDDTVHKRPELDVASGASLTIGATLSLNADSKLVNEGTVIVGGAAEFADQSVLQNSGMLVLRQGGDFAGQSSITNNEGATIEVAGGTLNVTVDIANFGHIAIDTGAALTVDGSVIDGGTISVAAFLIIGAHSDVTIIINDGGHGNGGVTIVTTPGVLNLEGVSALTNGALDNVGQVDVGGTVSFDNESVNNLGGTITITGTLLLDDGTTISDGQLNNSGTIQVETTYGATLDGVTVDNNGGTIAVDCDSSPATVTLVLDDGTSIGNGDLNIGRVGMLEISSDSGATLDGVSVDNSGTIQVDGGSELWLDDGTVISGGTITNSGTLQVESADGATLDGVTVDNTDGIIAVDRDSSSDTVTLVLDDGTTIANGNLTIGRVGVLKISSEFGATLNGVNVDNSGTVQIDNGSTLTLDSTTVNGGTITDNGTVAVGKGKTLKLNGVSLSGGTVNNAGTIEITGSGRIEDDNFVNAAAAVLLIDAGQTLTLDGTTITGGAVTNDGTVHVDANDTLTLNTVTITGGDITNAGTISSTGGGDIDNANITNSGTIESTVGVMTIDPAGGGNDSPPPTFTLTNTGFLQANGGELDIIGEQIGNSGTVQAIHDSLLKLSSLTLTNTGDGTVSVDHGSTLDLAGANIRGGTVTIEGTLESHGSSFVDAAITNNGGIEVMSGWLTLAGSISGTGSATIDANATLELNLDDTQTIHFNGAGAELKLDGLHLTGPITGFAVSDKIDLGGICYGSATTASYNAETGVLSISDGHGDHIDLNIGTGYDGAAFAGGSDGAGGTLITLNAADDAPAFTQAPQTASFSEQANATGSPDPSPLAGGTLTFTDVDLTDRPTVGITAQHVVWTDANGTTDLSASLTPDQISAIEHALSLTPASGNANNGSVAWSYSIADSELDFLGQGQTLTLTTTVTVDDHHGQTASTPITIIITGADDAPTIAFDGTAPISTDQGTPVAINGISVADVDGGNSTELLTLKVDHGTITFDGQTGSSLTLSGTLATIDAALAKGITYTPAPDYYGGDALQVTINDQAPNGAALSASSSVALSITQDVLTAHDDAIVSGPQATEQILFKQNTGTTIADSVLLANDTGSFGRTFTITGVSGQSAHGGTVTLDGNSIDYMPAQNYTGADSFTYTISDGVTTSTGTVSFDVKASAPVVTLAPFHWINSKGGDFAGESSWSTNQVPGAGDDAVIDARGTYTVTSSIDKTINSLTTVSGATLDVTGGTFAIESGTGRGSNHGTIIASQSGEIDIFGPVNNRTGILRADGHGAHLLLEGNVTANHLLEATDGGLVTIDGITINNAHGLIEASGTVPGDTDLVSSVTLINATIKGGTISGDHGGIVEVLAPRESSTTTTLDGSTKSGAVAVTGEFLVGHDATLHLAGEIDNSAAINVLGDISVDGDVTLADHGSLMLNGGAIDGRNVAHDSLENHNLIEGYGYVGAGHLRLENFGTIDSTDSNNPMTIDTGPTGTFFNEGMVKSDGYGVEIVHNVVNDGVFESSAQGGLIQVDGNYSGSGTVILDGGNVAFEGRSNAAVQFSGTGSALFLDHVSQFSGSVTGFGYGDLMYLADTASRDVHVVDHRGQIEVRYGTGAHDFFVLHGDYDPNGFSIAQDGTGTDITWNHPAPTIVTDSVTLSQDGGVTTIHGLSVEDADSSATSFMLSVTTGHARETGVTPSSEAGDLDAVNDALSAVTYNPGANPPQAGQVNVTVTDNFGDSSTVHFIFNEAGAGPNISLAGTSGNDVIFATGQPDTLTGEGGQDHFVFKPSNPLDTVTVEHIITDFNVNLDTIDLRQFTNVSSLADLIDTATTQNGDTLLTLDDHQTLLLKNVAASSLHASDFIVTPHGSVGV